jgi:hypothetical protein
METLKQPQNRRRFLKLAAGISAGATLTESTSTAAASVITLSGYNAPRKSLGRIGDFYVNLRAHSIYGPKTKQGWGIPMSLLLVRGPNGKQGIRGIVGKDGMSGIQGPMGYSVLHGDNPPTLDTGQDNDFYIDTTFTQIYGPKEDGIWGSPVSMTGQAYIAVIDGGSL